MTLYTDTGALYGCIHGYIPLKITVVFPHAADVYKALSPQGHCHHTEHMQPIQLLTVRVTGPEALECRLKVVSVPPTSSIDEQLTRLRIIVIVILGEERIAIS